MFEAIQNGLWGQLRHEESDADYFPSPQRFQRQFMPLPDGNFRNSPWMVSWCRSIALGWSGHSKIQSMSHDRRRVLHFNVTEHPMAIWAAQQNIEAFPEDTVPRYLIRDRDGIYGESFRARVEGINIEQILIAPRSPWQNCYVERLIGSIRRECLNHVRIIQIPQVGGLHHRYERRAA